jgi:hypothetical protein
MGGLVVMLDQADVVGIHASPRIVRHAWIGMAVAVGFQSQVETGMNLIGSWWRQRRNPVGSQTYMAPSAES